MSRKWCFTINNPNKVSYDGLEKLKNLKTVQNLVYQKEVGKNKNLHIQGFVRFRNKVDLKVLKKKFPRAHFEISRGSLKDNLKYCTKTEGQMSEPFIKGNFENEKWGGRSDLQLFKDAILEGMSEEDLWEHFTKEMARFPKMYKSLTEINLKKKAFKTYKESKEKEELRKVIVLVGKTGTGKTSYIYKKHDIEEIYTIEKGTGSLTSLWFDGYTGQKVVLFDDFYGWIKYDTMLRLLDIYPKKVQVKGAFTWLIPEVIYITSNSPPEQWYKNVKDTNALLRRITKVIKMEKMENPRKRKKLKVKNLQ